MNWAKKTKNRLQSVNGSWCEKLREFWQAKWQYLLVVVFGLILTATLWGAPGRLLIGDDAAFQAVRLTGALHGWMDGQLIPQVDPRALGGFGYGYNLFYGPLLTYAAGLLRLVCMSWPVAINCVMTLCLVGAGLLMCYAMMRISRKQILAATAGVIYMAMPYFLINLYQRVALGEVAAMVLAPLLILGLYQLVNQEEGAIRNLVLAGGGMILTHSLSTVVFVLMAAVYVLLNIKRVWNWATLKKALLAVAVVLGVTAWFWLPMLEVRATGYYGIFDAEYSDLHMGATAGMLNGRRVPIAQLINADYDINVKTDQNVTVGIVAVFALVMFPLVRRRIVREPERRMVTILYGMGIGALVLMTAVVDWRFMPKVLYILQFPWRFLEVFAVVMSVVGAYTIYELIKEVRKMPAEVLTVIVGFVVILPVSGIYQYQETRRLGTGVMPEAVVGNGSIGWQAEYLTLGTLCVDGFEAKDVVGGCDFKHVQARLDARGQALRIKSGEGEVREIRRDGTHFEFIVDGEDEIKVELPLIYYPGYVAKTDGKRLEIKPSQDMGLVEVTVPAGAKQRTVEVHYGMTTATKIGLGISVLTVVGCAVMSVRRRQARSMTR